MLQILNNWKPVNGFFGSGDQDEMLQNVAFNQGLHCLLTLKQSLETEIHHNLEILMYRRIHRHTKLMPNFPPKGGKPAQFVKGHALG